MKYLQNKRLWIMLVLIVSFGCKPNLRNECASTSLIDLALWNQETINHLIVKTRIDTTYFEPRKPYPPSSIDLPYSYPNESKAIDNDLATVWSFINQRSYIKPILDSLLSLKIPNGEIFLDEFYQAQSSTHYEIFFGDSGLEIIIESDGSKITKDLLEQSEMADGFVDYRQNNAPIRTMRTKFRINCCPNGSPRLLLLSLYFDSNYSWDK